MIYIGVEQSFGERSVGVVTVFTARTPRRADDGAALHTLSRSPLAAHLGGCAPPSRLKDPNGVPPPPTPPPRTCRWREMSKMAACRAAPARDADTGTPRRDARREPTEPPTPLSNSRVPLVQPLRDDAREDARVALSVPPGVQSLITVCK